MFTVVFNLEIRKIMFSFCNRSIFIMLTLIGIVTVNYSCKDDDDEEELLGNWVEMSDFEGVPRSDAVVFTIGNKAYVGSGYDGDSRLTDFWEYDGDKNNWKSIAEFPGVARNGAVAFGTDTKGYVGCGYDGINKLNDFWSYDPQTNTWDSIAEFGGSARYGAVAFSINNKGYVGTGYDGNYLKDFWQYDPESDTWTQKTSIGGGKRKDAVAFVIDGLGYVVTGIDNGSYENDFWRYDPTTDEWEELRSVSDASEYSYDDEYTSITGIDKAVFTSGERAFLVGGSGTIAGTVWEYNSVTDLWSLKNSLEGAARIDAVTFTINNTGYITTGRSSAYYFDDIWMFEPDAELNEYD